MHDDYLQNVSVQSIAYVLAVLTWNGLTALLAGHSTFWGAVLVGSIHMAILALPFWLVDVLLLRPMLRFINSPKLCAAELAVLFLNWSVVHAPGLVNSSRDPKIWRDIITTSLALGVIYVAISWILNLGLKGNASTSRTA
jgi:hypothetical protein